MTNRTLLCHPRSGSNWFFECLTDIKYSQGEYFGPWYSTYQNIRPSAIFKMMDNTKKFYKVHFMEISRTKDESRREAIIEGLQQRELYFLERKDVKSAIVSFLIALKNVNFIGPVDSLQSLTLTEQDVINAYDGIYGSIDKYKSLFKFKEEFTYEDLIDGSQHPKSFAWDKSNAKISKRNSIELVHLIKNWDKAETWIDNLPKR